jgi:hypothetical protein
MGSGGVARYYSAPSFREAPQADTTEVTLIDAEGVKVSRGSQTLQARRFVALLLTAAILTSACGQDDSSAPSSISTPSSAASAAASTAPPTPEPTEGPYDDLWQDATAATIGATKGWTNKVEIADINGDRLPDILFANGGAYETPGPPEANQVFLNGGPGQPFEDATTATFGEFEGLTRVIKVRDLNADAIPDILVGTTYRSQSQLFLGTGDGAFELATSRLPQVPLSVGDLEIGDVDADGDLDVVLADWAPGSPMDNEGGRVHLWLNDGTATFTDAASSAMPDTLVQFSWELELLDVDNDWDLDLAVSAKRSASSFLFVNDGSGSFTDETAERMPAFTNNYEFEAMDLDADGFLDLVTINDGIDTGRGGREHVFRNDGTGAYVDVTADWWPDSENPGEDDNQIAFLDVESDGDADFIIGALTGPDRLMINDGTGHLTLAGRAFNARLSEGTLGIAVADLNGDGRLDVVEGQGENPSATEERVYLATDRVATDTAPPVIGSITVRNENGNTTVLARVTDGTSPSRSDQLERVELRLPDSSAPIALDWYGEYLFRAIAASFAADGVQLCAVDRAGNERCEELP